MERFGTGYRRSATVRWPQPIPAIVALVLTLAVFYATWWIFQDLRWMRLYTPMSATCTRAGGDRADLMVYIFNYWPFKRSWLENTHPLVKGAILTAISVAILLVLIKGFRTLLGNYGSPTQPRQPDELPRMTEFFASVAHPWPA
jgi:AAT family amino acid transporter